MEKPYFLPCEHGHSDVLLSYRPMLVVIPNTGKDNTILEFEFEGESHRVRSRCARYEDGLGYFPFLFNVRIAGKTVKLLLEETYSFPLVHYTVFSLAGGNPRIPAGCLSVLFQDSLDESEVSVPLPDSDPCLCFYVAIRGRLDSSLPKVLEDKRDTLDALREKKRRLEKKLERISSKSLPVSKMKKILREKTKDGGRMLVDQFANTPLSDDRSKMEYSLFKDSFNALAKQNLVSTDDFPILKDDWSIFRLIHKFYILSRRGEDNVTDEDTSLLWELFEGFGVSTFSTRDLFHKVLEHKAAFQDQAHLFKRKVKGDTSDRKTDAQYVVFYYLYKLFSRFHGDLLESQEYLLRVREFIEDANRRELVDRIQPGSRISSSSVVKALDRLVALEDEACFDEGIDLRKVKELRYKAQMMLALYLYRHRWAKGRRPSMKKLVDYIFPKSSMIREYHHQIARDIIELSLEVEYTVLENWFNSDDGVMQVIRDTDDSDVVVRSQRLRLRPIDGMEIPHRTDFLMYCCLTKEEHKVSFTRGKDAYVLDLSDLVVPGKYVLYATYSRFKFLVHDGVVYESH